MPLALVATSFALVWLTAFLGPSAASRGAPGGGPLPVTLGLAPSAWLVTALLALAAVAGASGIALAWRRVRAGWTPNPTRLVAGALVATAAFVVVPPVTSDDVYSYAAYGRMVTVGLDPYATRPDQLHDPVGDAVGDPWRASPSIYGPLATAEQAAVMAVAGTNVRLGVWLLQLLGAAAFAVTVLVLDRVARASGGDGARRRAALLFSLNPLVLVHLVAGAHVDALLVACAAGALALLRAHPLAAGALAGAGFSVKLTGALVVAGLLVPLRRSVRAWAPYLLGVGLVAAPAYAVAGGLSSLGQARLAARFVSFASPWRPFAERLDARMGFGHSRGWISSLALAAAVALAVLLWRRFPGRDHDARPALVLTLAWLLAATYVLPWYDALAWLLLAVVVAPGWDYLLLARTTILTLAYLPGRTVPLPDALASALSATRKTVAPVVLGATVLFAIWLVRKTATREPSGVPSRSGR